MLYVIGVIKDNNSIYGYRILDTNTQTTKDIELSALIKKMRLIKVENFSIKDGKLHENYAEESKYPVYDKQLSKLTANKIVILCKSGQDYTVTDYTGKIRNVSFDQINACDREVIANIKSFPEFKPNEAYKNIDKSVGENVDKQSNVGIGVKNNLDFKEYCASIIADISQRSLVEVLDEIDFKQLSEVSSKLKNSEITVEIPDKHDEKSDDTVGNSEQSDSGIQDKNGVIGEQSNTTKTTDDLKEVQGDNSEYSLKIEEKDDRRVILCSIDPYDYRGDVVIPDGVTHINDRAFTGSKIKSCIIPDTVIYIGEYAFKGTEVQTINLPLNVKAIPHYCFKDAYKLKSINLEHITSIGNYAFMNTALEEVHLKSDVLQVGIASFCDCRSLTTFEHLPTLRKIRESAFKSCYSLENFDFSGICEIEEKAFDNTGLHTVVINGEVTYVKPFTFTSPNLTEVIINEGCYKLADNAFINKGDPKAITYTIPKSVSNIGVNLLKEEDTVRCYHNSIAESTAKLSGSTIEYIDDTSLKSKVVAKANMLGLDIPKLISDMITTIYSSEDVDYTYELDENGLLNVELTEGQLDYLGLSSCSTPVGYEEKPKFKVLLDHYHKACQINGFGLSSRMISLKNTFSIENKIIYNDGISRIIEFEFLDHKFESKKAKYIVALTGNNVRYCCLNNRFTDLYCRTTESKDLKKLLDVLVPGDTIGYSCTIGGRKYEDIAGKGNQKNKNGELLSVNIYQAIFNCSIAVKLDRNHLALILPANNKIIKCASLGKSVWANENEESYSNRYCVVEDIQDLPDNTILDYGVNSPSRDDRLFNELSKLSDSEVAKRMAEYATIGKSKLSQYYEFRNYCIKNRMDRVEELDLYGLGILMNFPLVEERTADWLDRAVDKTVVPASKHEIYLSDESSILQYKTVKRVAMRNKLLTGGDRTIYVYEIFNSMNDRLKIFASSYDIDDLFNLAMDIKVVSDKPSKIYKDPSHFDIVPLNDMLLVAAAFVNTHERGEANSKSKQSSIWLSVYKPNGLYYLSYIGNFNYVGKVAVPLIQIGDFDIVLDYIDCANTSSARGYTLLTSAGYEEVRRAIERKRYGSVSGHGSGLDKPYNKLLMTRELAINGNLSTDDYLDTGVSPVLCHMFGINSYGDEIYDAPKEDPANEPDNYEIDFGDGSDEHTENVEDEEFELDIDSEEPDEDSSDLDEQDAASEAFRISQMLKDN